MQRVIFDFFSVCISNKLSWLVVKTPINFDEIVSENIPSEQKNKLSSYLKIINPSDLDTLKANDRSDFVWGVQPYMKEIISKMIYDWDGNDKFWSDTSWGLDIQAYYLKKVYFLPKGLPSCYSISDFLQLAFWEAAATSGGLLKFKKIDTSSQEVTKPIIDKEFYNINEAIAYVKRMYLLSGFEIQQVSNGSELKENEFVLDNKAIFEVTNFMYAKEDLAETVSLLETGNVKYLLNRNKEFCFSDIVSETYDGKLTKSIPIYDPTKIPYKIGNIKGSASTPELMAMYENRLDLIHKNGKIDKNGVYSISSLVSKEQVPVFLNDTNLLLDTFVSTSAGVESIREIYKHLMILAELIYEKGIVYDSGVKPVKYVSNNILELPYLTNKVDTGTVQLGQELVPYSSKIIPHSLPFDIANDFSVLNVKNSISEPTRPFPKFNHTPAQTDVFLGKKTFFEKIKKLESLVFDSKQVNGLPKFTDNLTLTNSDYQVAQSKHELSMPDPLKNYTKYESNSLLASTPREYIVDGLARDYLPIKVREMKMEKFEKAKNDFTAQLDNGEFYGK